MLHNPDDLRYTKTHEWVRTQDDGIEIGITDFAQRQLSDITYVELPELSLHLNAGEEAVVVESIKAASDVYAPIAGTIVEVNEALADKPEVINADPFGAGWLFRMKPDHTDDVNTLLSAEAYEANLPAEH
ncbi:MAG: glycine cleavage system protein GcvH [Verrucomicrobiota bacterium]